MKIPFEWESIQRADKNTEFLLTSRVKVIGGWLVKTICGSINDSNISDSMLCQSMVFVPDVNHEWEIE